MFRKPKKTIKPEIIPSKTILGLTSSEIAVYRVFQEHGTLSRNNLRKHFHESYFDVEGTINTLVAKGYLESEVSSNRVTLWRCC